MHPVLFQFGKIHVYSYGFFVALGVLLAMWWLAKKLIMNRKSPQIVVDLVLVVMVSGIIGARLAYILLYDPFYYFMHPGKILMLQEGGLAFYGGFIFGLMAAYLYLRRIKVPFLAFMDTGSSSLALGYAVARIGCFLNGCCYGKPTDLGWGIVFPVVDNLPRHPTQLYSSLSGLIIFAVLEFLLPRRRFEGQIFSLFLIMYGFFRSSIELLRENQQLLGGASVASLAALTLALMGMLLYVYLAKRGIPPSTDLGREKD